MNETSSEKQSKLSGRGLDQCRKVLKNEALENLCKGLDLRRKLGGG